MCHSYFAGDLAGRGVLPDHEAVDGEPEPVIGGAGLGADVAGHRAVCLQPEPDEGPEPVPAHPAPPHRPGLDPQAAEDHQTRPAQVSAAPGRGRGHPAQNHADFPQSLLPGRH